MTQRNLDNLPPQIVVATSNAHKTEEIRSILGSSLEVKDLSDFPELVPAEETGTTFEENSEIKALSVSRDLGGETLVLSDDSGLEVDALDGAPGVYSARYSGEGADDASNRRHLRSELERCPSYPGIASARFRCVMTLAQADKVLAVFNGTVEGRILTDERGEGGFGYDPLFIPEGHELTFAELSLEVKNTLSHRGRAISNLVKYLQQSP